MSGDSDELDNEYESLPDDPELAYAVYYQRKYRVLEKIWETNQDGGGWFHERRFVDHLVAFDEVHNLGLFADWHPPAGEKGFGDFFQEFRRYAEIAAEKIKLESARRAKNSLQPVIFLDAATRPAIHLLIEAIREKLNALDITDAKREALFNKLNAFAAEVDRNRTRTEAAFAFAVDLARTVGVAHSKTKDVWDTVFRVFDKIDKAKKLPETLPPWSKRKEIEGPPKQIEASRSNLDEDIPF